jgi:hypothetical protein
VGVIDVERQGGGLDGGSTLNQQETHKVEQYLISVKKQQID